MVSTMSNHKTEGTTFLNNGYSPNPPVCPDCGLTGYIEWGKVKLPASPVTSPVSANQIYKLFPYRI
ncbi:hypothetical protein LCGC14_2727730, partial [marine sediment metagenome]